MSPVHPQGESLRNALKWLAEKRKENPGLDPVKLADEAGFRFDLSPKDSAFLMRMVKDGDHQDPA